MARKPKDTGKLNHGRLRELAKGGTDVAAAEKALRLRAGSLEGLLKTRKRAAAAWRRGRRLFEVHEMAREGCTRPAAARALEISEPAFERELTEDAELGAEWSAGQAEYTRRYQRMLHAEAEKGSVAALREIAANRQAETRATRPAGEPDPAAVSLGFLAKALNTTRQTLHNWSKEDIPLPRNPDGTYALPAAITWWHRRAMSAETGGERGGERDRDEQLKAQKIEKLSLENAARRGELLDRRLVTGGYVARAQQFVRWLEGRSASLTSRIQGQPPKKMMATLDADFAELRRTMMHPPEVLRLQGEAATLLGKLMKAMEPKGAEDG